jgi:hypothetical protein
VGLLSPLFLLGLLGISLPILFHLIRRTPKGQMAFSTLMFLQPSPPQITRRSRLDNLLLLLLRATALAILAMAFARPFLREATKLTVDSLAGRRIAIVVDGSASMQQPGVWRKVRQTVDKVVADLKPGDHAALFLFDEKLTTLQGFADANEFESDAQSDAVLDAMRAATPSWRATDIGEALVQAADILASSSEIDRDEHDKQIILITDMQQGASLEGLQATTFPDDIRVDVRAVSHQPGSNASIQVLSETDPQTFYRVRVVNGEESTSEQFSLNWLDGNLKPVQIAKEQIYVAPGQNRVIQVDKPSDAGLVCLELVGDESDLGNRFFVLNSPPNAVAVTYLGELVEQPTKPLYFFRRSLTDTSSLTIDLAHPQTPDEIVARLAGDGKAGLIAVAGTDLDPTLRTAEVWNSIGEAVKSGAHLLWVVTEADQSAMDQVLGQGWSVETTQGVGEGEYAMWSGMQFEHRLFAPFANPRYSDFTGIKFWKWRQVTIPDDAKALVLANYDRGGNAVIHTRVGEGAVILLASGWSPNESQLALSTKFLPIIHSTLPLAGNRYDSMTRFEIGDQIRAVSANASELQMKLPNGEVMKLDTANNRQGDDAKQSPGALFATTERPGIYQLVDKKGEAVSRYAVNVASRETDTRMRDAVELEQYGVSLGTQPTRAQQLSNQRQLRDVQLEKRQQLWRWGIAVAMLVLLIETILAGRTARNSLDSLDPLTTEPSGPQSLGTGPLGTE